jgi:hypothetical protein
MQWLAQFSGGLASMRQLWETTTGVHRPEVVISLADAARTDSIHYTIYGPDNCYLVGHSFLEDASHIADDTAWPRGDNNMRKRRPESSEVLPWVMDRSRHGQNFAHLYLRDAAAWANSFYSAQFMEVPPAQTSTVGVLAAVQALTVCSLALYRLFGNQVSLSGGLITLLPSLAYLISTLSDRRRRLAVSLAPRALSFFLVMFGLSAAGLTMWDSGPLATEVPGVWLIAAGGSLVLGIAAATGWWTHARMWARLSLRHREPDRYAEIITVYRDLRREWKKQDVIRRYEAGG